VPGLVCRQRDGQFLQGPGLPIEVDLHRLPLPRRDLVLRYRPEYFFRRASRGIAYEVAPGGVLSALCGPQRQAKHPGQLRPAVVRGQVWDAPLLTYASCGRRM
jgi:hypothetical protein